MMNQLPRYYGLLKIVANPECKCVLVDFEKINLELSYNNVLEFAQDVSELSGLGLINSPYNSYIKITSTGLFIVEKIFYN
ncbi:MAG: hypothetical protein GON13_00145 [Nanoarchaeota archaeon]|nr:hypothetical protein [Nanoarchaeota archaeon]